VIVGVVLFAIIVFIIIFVVVKRRRQNGGRVSKNTYTPYTPQISGPVSNPPSKQASIHITAPPTGNNPLFSSTTDRIPNGTYCMATWSVDKAYYKGRVDGYENGKYLITFIEFDNEQEFVAPQGIRLPKA